MFDPTPFITPLGSDQLFGDHENRFFGGSSLLNTGAAAIAEKGILNLMQSQLKLTEKHIR